MLFNSLSYLAFLVIAIGLLSALRNHALLVLTVLSCLFYSLWRPEYLILVVAVSFLDYNLALAIERSVNDRRRMLFLWISIAANIGVLVAFKYSFFFLDNMYPVLSALGIRFDLGVFRFILPLGISFYTFEAISYTVDVYRRVYAAEQRFLKYFCFIVFFPKLIAGPILRARDLIPQFSNLAAPTGTMVREGINRILWGLFLKVVIADNVATLVDAGFAINTATISALDNLTLAFLFGFQIYLDFSSYSSIAIGSALMMGLTLKENFDFPYLATSPRDFWRRWHISLSEWVRDYIYIPLSNRFTRSGALLEGRKEVAANVALVITWTIMGLWHGANWTFVLWGVMHATYLLGYRFVRPLGERLTERMVALSGTLITTFLAMVAWIPFRAESLADAGARLATLTDPSKYTFLGLRENSYVVAALLLLGFWAFAFVMKVLAAKTVPLWARYAYYVLVGFAIIPLTLAFLKPVKQFIYFQF